MINSSMQFMSFQADDGSDIIYIPDSEAAVTEIPGADVPMDEPGNEETPSEITNSSSVSEPDVTEIPNEGVSEPSQEDGGRNEEIPTVPTVSPTPAPDAAEEMTKYNIDDLYSEIQVLQETELNLLDVQKMTNTLLLGILFFVSLLCGFLLARIVWRKL